MRGIRTILTGRHEVIVQSAAEYNRAQGGRMWSFLEMFFLWILKCLRRLKSFCWWHGIVAFGWEFSKKTTQNLWKKINFIYKAPKISPWSFVLYYFLLSPNIDVLLFLNQITQSQLWFWKSCNMYKRLWLTTNIDMMNSFKLKLSIEIKIKI